ncbi:protein YELLOW LEAF 1, choloroplastic-like isoform X1 [Juglans microcarpa x Juglans regia]|uniref:protein YELLOW LEAF 1, choloroplastic-like isoform X1 n=2 Tax=Juglans microcarpa x Juglans regia TaxID=2249226 RepID=UPI001B7E1E71|nr:protein YELLOW LEAF 1, choloroplastic-like isoform X1 [Juglans microcarpa x Juglans regia]
MVRTNCQHMEQTKLIRSNLGQVPVQFQPFDNRSGHLRIAKSVSMPFSHVDRRQPRMRSSQMQQSSSVVCHVGLNARCSAATSEQTKTVTQKAATISGIPGKEKAAKLDDGGFGFPPHHDGGGGGGGGGGGDSSSGGWILFAVLGVLGFLKDKEIEWRNQKDK